MAGPASPFDRFTGGGTPLMPQRAPVQPATPQRRLDHPGLMHIVRGTHADVDQAAMIRKRDSAGEIMDKLASIANAPEINRADIAAYIGGMIRKGDMQPDEATAILRALPEDQDGMRQWARHVFAIVMNVGIHAHAAYPREAFPGDSSDE